MVTYDVLMAATWILTYFLVFISTYIEKKTIIPLASALVIFPWEFATFIGTIRSSIDYVWLAEFGWFTIDLGIIILLYTRCKSFKSVLSGVLYAVGIIMLTVIMMLIFQYNGQLFTSYFNTIIGIVIWLIFTCRKGYVYSNLNLIILITKFTADFLGCIYYYDKSIIVGIMAVLLPIIDVIHILVFAIKKNS